VRPPFNRSFVEYDGPLSFRRWKSGRSPSHLRDGRVAYTLMLEPQPDSDSYVSSVWLYLLPHAHGHAVKPSLRANLLAPPGNWHGYQQFMFAASDFVHGADKSLFGATRDFADAVTPLRVKGHGRERTCRSDAAQIRLGVLLFRDRASR